MLPIDARFGALSATASTSELGDSTPSTAVLQATLKVWGALGRQHAIAVHGHSMWPTIRDGDRIWIAFGAADIEPGDVIVYRTGSRRIVHRVLALWGRPGQRQLITQGDHSSRRDPSLEESQIVGRVVSVERSGRNRRLLRGRVALLLARVFWLLAKARQG